MKISRFCTSISSRVSRQSAAKAGQTAALEATNAPVAASMKAFEAAQKTRSVGQLLAQLNDPPRRGMEVAGVGLSLAWVLEGR